MFTITVDKECGCFRKSDFENGVTFENKDDALIQAQSMVNHMNTKFCGKHNFTLSEDGENFSIAMNVPEQPAHTGCCGGGHCS
jgi:hypothetical protein